MRPRVLGPRVTMPPMTTDAHTQANADQVLLLREALAVELSPGPEVTVLEEPVLADVPVPASEASPLTAR